MTTTESVLAHKVQWKSGSIYKPCGDPDCSLEHMTFPDFRALCTWNMLMDSNGWKYLGFRKQPDASRVSEVWKRAARSSASAMWKGIYVPRNEPDVVIDRLFDAYAANALKDTAAPPTSVSDFELLVHQTRAARFAVLRETLGDGSMPTEILLEDVADQSGEEAVMEVLSCVAPELVAGASYDEAMESLHDEMQESQATEGQQTPMQKHVSKQSMRMAACAYARLNRNGAKKLARNLIAAAGISLHRASSSPWADKDLNSWCRKLEEEYRRETDRRERFPRGNVVIPKFSGYKKFWLFGVSAVASFDRDDFGLWDVEFEARRHKSTLLRDYLTNVYFHPGDVRYLSPCGTEYPLMKCRRPKTKKNKTSQPYFTEKEAVLLGTLLDTREAPKPRQ